MSSPAASSAARSSSTFIFLARRVGPARPPRPRRRRRPLRASGALVAVLLHRLWRGRGRARRPVARRAPVSCPRCPAPAASGRRGARRPSFSWPAAWHPPRRTRLVFAISFERRGAVLGSNAREIMAAACSVSRATIAAVKRAALLFLGSPALGCLSCQIAQAVNILPQRSMLASLSKVCVLEALGTGTGPECVSWARGGQKRRPLAANPSTAVSACFRPLLACRRARTLLRPPGTKPRAVDAAQAPSLGRLEGGFRLKLGCC